MSTIATLTSTESGANSLIDINNNFSALNSGKIETTVLDTDGTLAANSDSKVATQKATKTYVDTGVASAIASYTVKKSYSNYYISDTDTIGLFTSDVADAYCQTVAGAAIVRFEGEGLPIQTRTISTDWAAADRCLSAVLYGAYLYLVLTDDGTTTSRVYRYDKTNLAGGATLMTTSGQSIGSTLGAFYMLSDSSGNFYMTNQAGNSASNHIISKYSVSGTVMTFVSNTTCGSTSGYFERFLKVDDSGNFYGWNYSTDNIPRKYNSSGTLTTTYVVIKGDVSSCLAGNVYVRKSNTAAGGEVYSKINL